MEGSVAAWEAEAMVETAVAVETGEVDAQVAVEADSTGTCTCNSSLMSAVTLGMTIGRWASIHSPDVARGSFHGWSVTPYR